jgi:hypothetical protein
MAIYFDRELTLIDPVEFAWTPQACEAQRSSISHVELRQILFGGDGHDANSLPGRFRRPTFCLGIQDQE